MKVRIQMVIENAAGIALKIEEISRLTLLTPRANELGLSLGDAKLLVQRLQQAVVTAQIAEYLGRFNERQYSGAAMRRRTHNPQIDPGP